MSASGVRPTLLESVLFPHVRPDGARLRQAVEGRTLVITGASYGIGEKVALACAGAGAQVLLVARTAARLDALCAEIKAEGGRAIALPADLTHPEQVEALLERLAAFAVDAFVSNAGKSIRRPVMQSLERNHDFTRTMALNYHAPVRLALGLIPGLRARGGHIVSVSAANVLLAPAPHWAAYQASKAAFDQWLRSAGPELRAAGIAATSVYLPLVRTRMITPTEAYRDMPAMSPGQAAAAVCRTLVTRAGAWKPWWLPGAEAASLMLRRPWEALATRQLRRGDG